MGNVLKPLVFVSASDEDTVYSEFRAYDVPQLGSTVEFHSHHTSPEAQALLKLHYRVVGVHQTYLTRPLSMGQAQEPEVSYRIRLEEI